MARIRGSRFSDDIYGTDSSDTIEGLEGHDRIWGFGGDDLLIGGPGDDDLDGGSGADRMEGGSGDDLYIVDSTGDQVVELPGEGVDVILTSLDAYALPANVEDLVALSSRDFRGTGNNLDNYIYGYSGNDVLDGGLGNDVLIGELGDDTYFVDDAGDEVIEYAGEGYDTVFTSLAALALAANVEELIFDGSGNFTGTGNARDNYIEGAAGNDLLDGREGDDILNGGAGADRMLGGGGNDAFFVDNAGDQVVESAGNGRDIVYASTSYALAAGESVEILSTASLAGTAAIHLTGNQLNQLIYGNAGANSLNSGGGADTLIGLRGDDIYLVSDGRERIVENAGEGRDVVYTSVTYALDRGAEIEVLSSASIAAATTLYLVGNEFGQEVLGNNGLNYLDGGLGADALIGYGNADTFAFTTALGGGNIDRIVDFQAGLDRIGLDDAVFRGLTPGGLPPGAFRVGTSAQDADDRIIYDQASGALYYDADGAGGAAAVQFATLSAGTVLTANDFTVI